MRPQTAMAEAMTKAGIDTDAPLLRSIAEEQLRKANLAVMDALDPFTKEMRDAMGVTRALISCSLVRDLASPYLESIAADMRGDTLKNPAKAGDAARLVDQGRLRPGRVDISEDEESVGCLLSRRGHGSSSSDSDPSEDGSGASMPYLDAGSRLARRSIPNNPRGIAAMRLQSQRRTTMFETFNTRQGPIGDLKWSSLPRLIGENTREATLLKMIYEHAVPANGNARIREIIDLPTLQRMIQKAAEIAGD